MWEVVVERALRKYAVGLESKPRPRYVPANCPQRKFAMAGPPVVAGRGEDDLDWASGVLPEYDSVSPSVVGRDLVAPRRLWPSENPKWCTKPIRVQLKPRVSLKPEVGCQTMPRTQWWAEIGKHWPGCPPRVLPSFQPLLLLAGVSPRKEVWRRGKAGHISRPTQTDRSALELQAGVKVHKKARKILARLRAGNNPGSDQKPPPPMVPAVPPPTAFWLVSDASDEDAILISPRSPPGGWPSVDFPTHVNACVPCARSSWVRPLDMDGDVKKNPGPGVSSPDFLFTTALKLLCEIGRDLGHSLDIIRLISSAPCGCESPLCFRSYLTFVCAGASALDLVLAEALSRLTTRQQVFVAWLCSRIRRLLAELAAVCRWAGPIPFANFPVAREVLLGSRFPLPSCGARFLNGLPVGCAFCDRLATNLESHMDWCADALFCFYSVNLPFYEGSLLALEDGRNETGCGFCFRRGIRCSCGPSLWNWAQSRGILPPPFDGAWDPTFVEDDCEPCESSNGPGHWLHDQTLDGDVQQNPGPATWELLYDIRLTSPPLGFRVVLHLAASLWRSLRITWAVLRRILRHPQGDQHPRLLRRDVEISFESLRYVADEMANAAVSWPDFLVVAGCWALRRVEALLLRLQVLIEVPECSPLPFFPVSDMPPLVSPRFSPICCLRGPVGGPRSCFFCKELVRGPDTFSEHLLWCEEARLFWLVNDPSLTHFVPVTGTCAMCGADLAVCGCYSV